MKHYLALALVLVVVRTLDSRVWASSSGSSGSGSSSSNGGPVQQTATSTISVMPPSEILKRRSVFDAKAEAVFSAAEGMTVFTLPPGDYDPTVGLITNPPYSPTAGWPTTFSTAQH